jgi:hypothetical protein
VKVEGLPSRCAEFVFSCQIFSKKGVAKEFSSSKHASVDLYSGKTTYKVEISKSESNFKKIQATTPQNSIGFFVGTGSIQIWAH